MGRVNMRARVAQVEKSLRRVVGSRARRARQVAASVARGYSERDAWLAQSALEEARVIALDLGL